MCAICWVRASGLEWQRASPKSRYVIAGRAACFVHKWRGEGFTATDDVMHFMRLDTRLAPLPPPSQAIQTCASNLTPSQHAGRPDTAGLPQAPCHRAGWSSGSHLEAVPEHCPGQRHSPRAEARSVRAVVELASLVGVGESVEANLSRGVLAYAIVTRSTENPQ